MIEPEELPLFEPRFGIPSERAGERRSSLRNDVLAALRGRRTLRARPRRAFRSRVAVRPPAGMARRVIVKAHYIRMSPYGAKAAALHVRYIVRGGVERDGSKGVLYSEAGPTPQGALEEPRFGEQHQFRLIVSPEDGGELDLTEYVQRLMATVEKDVGQRLEWAAVNHFDTGHPHAHVVVRGVDRDGREVRLDRGYISQGLRWRAQELATEELGPRHEHDVQRALAKEVREERFTSLDRQLERRSREGHVESRPARPANDALLMARLEYLEKMRLVERRGPRDWKLAPGWDEQLREMGRRGDIIKQIHASVPADPTRCHILRPSQTPPHVLTGRVAAKGLADELKGTFYAVIETPAGDAYHVPLDRRAAEEIRRGDIVSMRAAREAPVLPLDREIAAMASSRAGPYTPPASHEWRLRHHERLGLAKPEANGRWSVSPKLLEQLEERGRDGAAPSRLVVRRESLSLTEQTRHSGPVWLDRQRQPAPFGFGAEVRRAIEARRQFLRTLGIADGDPRRAAKLLELERRWVGQEVATRTGQTFVPDPAGTFRGRVEAPLPGLGRHQIVSNGSHFVVVPSTPSIRTAMGKTLMLSFDHGRRVVVRAVPDKDLGR